MTIKQRYSEVTERFAQNMPNPQTELNFDNSYQLLVAVILSAQCTDRRVNMVTPALFKAFPTVEALAGAEEGEVYEFIKSVTYPNAKSRNIVAMARMLRDKYSSEVPDTLDELVSLPGVGRKTANVMLSVVWEKGAMAVDTHVFRVSNRLGLTRNSKTPLATEKTLVKYFPADILPKAHHWLILHGRYVCQARKPKCGECFLSDICVYHASQTRKATNGKKQE